MWLADKLTDQDGCSVSFLDVLAPDMDSLVLPTSAAFGVYRIYISMTIGSFADAFPRVIMKMTTDYIHITYWRTTMGRCCPFAAAWGLHTCFLSRLCLG
jgi:hypothetical protein